MTQSKEWSAKGSRPASPQTVCLDAASARQLEHALGDIDGDRARSGVSLANHQGKIARAGGEIEHYRPVREVRAVEAGAFPVAVHAVGKGASDEVVTRRHGAEHGAHETGTLLLCWKFHLRGIVPSECNGQVANSAGSVGLPGPRGSLWTRSSPTPYRLLLVLAVRLVRMGSTAAPAARVPGGGAIEVSTMRAMA